jgi:predicted RNA binding protein YcfA (HicA-like mRNA interferase family)
MIIPRQIEAQQLTMALRKYGYQPTRQTGSHIRLTTYQNGQHHITIPNHDPIRTGTLNAILTEVALHSEIYRQDLAEVLF